MTGPVATVEWLGLICVSQRGWERADDVSASRANGDSARLPGPSRSVFKGSLAMGFETRWWQLVCVGAVVGLLLLLKFYKSRQT